MPSLTSEPPAWLGPPPHAGAPPLPALVVLPLPGVLLLLRGCNIPKIRNKNPPGTALQYSDQLLMNLTFTKCSDVLGLSTNRRSQLY